MAAEAHLKAMGLSMDLQSALQGLGVAAVPTMGVATVPTTHAPVPAAAAPQQPVPFAAAPPSTYDSAGAGNYMMFGSSLMAPGPAVPLQAMPPGMLGSMAAGEGGYQGLGGAASASASPYFVAPSAPMYSQMHQVKIPFSLIIFFEIPFWPFLKWHPTLP